jgi:hypothetical protein
MAVRDMNNPALKSLDEKCQQSSRDRDRDRESSILFKVAANF